MIFLFLNGFCVPLMFAQSTPTHIPLSTIPNPISHLRLPSNSLVAHPKLNFVGISYRGSRNMPFDSSGKVYLDINLNGGNPGAWQQKWTRLYTDSQNYNGNLVVWSARNPQISIYNPPGNMAIGNATLLGMADAINAANGDWLGLSGMTKPLSGSMGSQQLVSNVATGFNYGYAFDYASTNDGRIFFAVPEILYDTSFSYTGKIRVVRLTKSAVGQGFDTLIQDLTLPASKYTTASIGFSPNGLHGILAVSGVPNASFGLPEVNYPFFATTTDGGNSWSGFSLIDCNDPGLPTGTEQSIRVNMAGDSVFAGDEWRRAIYAIDRELDVSVDQYNQFHVFLNVHIGGFEPSFPGFEDELNSFQTSMVDFIIMPSGNIGATILRKPHTYRGCYNCQPPWEPVDQLSRPQISRSWDGEVLAFSWSETDSLTAQQAQSFGQNLEPDLWSRTITATDGPLQWKREIKPRNKTKGDFGQPVIDNDELAFRFGKCASYLMPNGNGYSIPAVYLGGYAVGFIAISWIYYLRYVHGIQARTDSLEPVSFLYPVVNRPLSAVTKLERATFTLFPNPAKNELYCSKEGFENTRFTISDARGKIWLSGKWAASVSVAQLPAGVYFYRISSPEGTRVQKWIKE